jgi:hypothetical protein
MYQICRHIKINGLRCQSPALRGSQFCYYHSKAHTVGAEPHLKYGPLQLPVPEDAASIQLSVARINDAIIHGRIELKKATALLYGIQIAAQFVDRKAYFHEEKTVQSAEQTANGDELAPGIYFCGKNDQCNNCPFCSVDQCKNWHYETEEEVAAENAGKGDDDKDGEEADTGDASDEADDSEDGDESEEIEEGDGGGDAEDTADAKDSEESKEDKPDDDEEVGEQPPNASAPKLGSPPISLGPWGGKPVLSEVEGPRFGT